MSQTETGGGGGRGDGLPRNEDGTFKRSASHDEIVAAMDPVEPYTAREIAEQIGEQRTTVNSYLNELHSEGRVGKKKHHSHRVTWYLPP